MRKRTALGLLPALGVSALPALACPACLPALASVLSTIGLTFLIYRAYLIWINLVALILALAILFARRRATGYAPFLFGAGGAVAIMIGKFVLASHALAWFGFAVLLVGSVGTTYRGRASRTCNLCGNSPANLGE